MARFENRSKTCCMGSQHLQQNKLQRERERMQLRRHLLLDYSVASHQQAASSGTEHSVCGGKPQSTTGYMVCVPIMQRTRVSQPGTPGAGGWLPGARTLGAGGWLPEATGGRKKGRGNCQGALGSWCWMKTSGNPAIHFNVQIAWYVS